MKLIIFEVIGLTLAIIINSHGIFIIEVKNYNDILKEENLESASPKVP